MTAKKKLKPRKIPRQERAQATVDAILQAAAYILVKDGWAQFNTNRVAERAGVNIASLYQYFPSKEALVQELQHRHAEHARAEFPRLQPVLQKQRSLRALLRVLVDAGIREHSVAPSLHRVFAQELPRSAHVTQHDDELVNQFVALAAPFIKNVPNVSLALYVARVATHAVIHEAASEVPALLAEPAFAEELVTLVERYLSRPLANRRASR